MAALVGGADPMPSVIVDGCTDPGRDDSSGALANCIDVGEASFFDVDVCSERGGATDDAAPYDCRHDPLSTQSPVDGS